MGTSSAYDIQGPGPISLLSIRGPSSDIAGSTVFVGAWKRIHPDCTRLTVEAKYASASAGATGGSSGVIELSHDGVTPSKTLAGSIQLVGTTDVVADGITLPSSILGVWPYIRYNMQFLSSATAQDTVASTVPSTTQSSLNVTLAGGWRT